MRVLLQKVSTASVRIDTETVGQIGEGYMILLGVLQGDTESQADALVQKICQLRLFPGEDGRMNDRSLLDIGGSLLIVSQFTLAGRMDKGNRPDYTMAEAPARAQELYDYFIEQCRAQGVQHVETGVFGANMDVSLVNTGPVTLLLERQSSSV